MPPFQPGVRLEMGEHNLVGSVGQVAKINWRRLIWLVSLEPCNSNKYWLGSLFLVWVIGVSYGVFIAVEHAWKPGESARLEDNNWPRFSNLNCSRQYKTLILFVHPKCPCTNASLIELRHLIERGDGEKDVKIVFFVPQDSGEDWIEEDKLMLASAVPRAEIVYDYDGKEMRIFGAVTSGLLYIFSKNKKLLYSGGITAGRGHQGDNPGLDQCIAILAQAESNEDCSKGAVFGCPMEQEK